MKHLLRTFVILVTLNAFLTGCYKDIDSGKSVHVSGYVKHAMTEEPIPNINIDIYGLRGTFASVNSKGIIESTTDSSGFYSIDFLTEEGFHTYRVAIKGDSSLSNGFFCSSNRHPCENTLDTDNSNIIDFSINTISLIKIELVNQDEINLTDSISIWSDSKTQCSELKCNNWSSNQETIETFYDYERGDTLIIYSPIFDFEKTELFFEITNEKGLQKFHKEFESTNINDTIELLIKY